MANSCGIIILAAGSSGRLGRPKQLLPYKNKTLLQYLIDEAKNSIARDIIVVLGANTEAINATLKTDTIHIAINKDWKEGMASSVRCGMNQLQKINPSADAAILMVSDQPFVTTALVNELINTYSKTSKLIVTSSYDNTTGPPALFHKTLFPELLELKGDFGARSIVQKYADNVATILFPQGSIDIDTIEDYNKVQR